MFLIVSLARTKEALRILHNDEDGILELYISAASRAVVRYLKGNAGELLSIDSPPNSPPDDLDDVPEDIALAVIMLTGIIYRQPDGDDAKAFAEHGYLPRPVTALLYPLRDPSFA
jgi:hypothetical protein